jgi:hypothetical protein
MQSMVATPEMVVEFVKERETKNTIRFQEVDNPEGEPPVIGTLYVQKWVLKRLGDPDRIAVAIRPGAAPATQP